MKRLLVPALLLLNAALLGVRSWQEHPAHAGPPPVATVNGDTNGDGKTDISDAVYLLTALFLGGPAPVACSGGGGPSGLPDTGQNACYGSVRNVGWQEVPCDSAACQGQDAQYATGCPSENRFTDNGDGTVRDHCTGLMWQKGTADVNGDGQSNDQDSLPWCDALAYCENLSFAGHADWRLPNVRELQSIA